MRNDEKRSWSALELTIPGVVTIKMYGEFSMAFFDSERKEKIEIFGGPHAFEGLENAAKG